MDNIYERYIRNFEANLLECKFLGKGHNGVVYMLPEGKVIKICFRPESCRHEYNILNKINSNKYFPKVYGMSGNYMIRDYVDGITLTKYIKKNGFNRELGMRLIELLEEFKKLKFTKLDIRCKDIMVQPDGNLKIIDPKKCYSKKRDFPRHLAKGLYKLGSLGSFMDLVMEKRPKLYIKWNNNIEEYINEKLEHDDL